MQHPYSTTLHFLRKSNHFFELSISDVEDIQEQEKNNNSFKLQSLGFLAGSRTGYPHPRLSMAYPLLTACFLSSVCGLCTIPEDSDR